jgi:hypothetical protein
MPTKFVNFEHTKCAVLFIIHTNRLIRLCQPAYQSRPSNLIRLCQPAYQSRPSKRLPGVLFNKGVSCFSKYFSLLREN